MASLVSAAGLQRRGELVDELLESIPAIPVVLPTAAASPTAATATTPARASDYFLGT